MEENLRNIRFGQNPQDLIIQVRVQTRCYRSGGAVKGEMFGRSIHDLSPDEAEACGYRRYLPTSMEKEMRRIHRMVSDRARSGTIKASGSGPIALTPWADAGRQREDFFPGRESTVRLTPAPHIPDVKIVLSDGEERRSEDPLGLWTGKAEPITLTASGADSTAGHLLTDVGMGLSDDRQDGGRDGDRSDAGGATYQGPPVDAADEELTSRAAGTGEDDGGLLRITKPGHWGGAGPRPQGHQEVAAQAQDRPGEPQDPCGEVSRVQNGRNRKNDRGRFLGDRLR